MRGILILAHGSREKTTENTLNEVVGHLKGIYSEYTIETAYLQFSDVNLKLGLDELKVKGISDIIVIPYFLFDGIHIREDIPKEIDEYRKENSDMRITMGKTLGSDKRLAEILADRIRESI
jgi:sirohydrochlorin ferrochelatase